jgi:hemerythrin-like metal-binding protein
MSSSSTTLDRQPSIQWNQDLVLDLPFMDETHQEFIDLLAAIEVADEANLLARYAEMVDHTDGHFGAEDRWMNETGFFSSSCHSMQHNVVMQVLREGLKRGQAGDLQLLRDLSKELVIWFTQHAQTMDAALATHLKTIGYDHATGQIMNPEALATTASAQQ